MEMKTTRRLFSLVVVGSMLLGGFVFKPISTKAVSNVWVEVSNPRPGANSDFKFHFTLENKLLVHEFIKIIFPKGFSYKKTITGTVDRKNPDYNVPIITDYPDGSFSFAFNTHIELDPSKEGYKDITVSLKKYVKMMGDSSEAVYEFWFFNPPTPGLVTFQVYTQAELDPVPSKPVLIQDYPMSTPIVDIEPNLIKEPAGYSLDFELNAYSEMKANEGTIQIQFPPESRLTKDANQIQPMWILLNDSFLNQKVSCQDNLLTFLIPQDLKSGQPISIKIDSRVGIVNPSQPGTYELTVKTSAEDRWYRSFPFFVAQEAPPALLKINPTFPNEIAEFELLLTTERVELKPLDTIYVRFPDTMKLPATIDPTSVYVNHKPIFQVSIDGPLIAIQLRSHAKSWMPLEITFTKAAGIKTPSTREPFHLELKIQKEADFIPTNLVELEKYTLAVVESFTAIWLLQEVWYAWSRDMINQELGPNRVAFITYYIDSTDDHPFPRLSCKESEERMKWYMPEDHGIVRMFFNGTDFIRGVPNQEDNSFEAKRKVVKDAIVKQINQVNQNNPPIKITATCTNLEKNSYRVSVAVQKLGPIKFSNLQLIAALTESNIPYTAINGEKIHYFVFREFVKPKEVKDTIGIPVNLDATGSSFTTEFTFDLNTELYKNELNLVFFVQDMTQKNILQGVVVPLKKE
jgi:hypothetical protein